MNKVNWGYVFFGLLFLFSPIVLGLPLLAIYWALSLHKTIGEGEYVKKE